MNLVTQLFIFLLGVYFCSGYGNDETVAQPQLDVQAPAYVPPYARNPNPGYRYSGTKTGYRGTKSYAGTKTGYAGTKTGYAGTKTGYVGTKNAYGEKKTWYSNSGMAPDYQNFVQNANNPAAGLCDVECKNNGICVDRNTCMCPPNFEGKFCEFEKKPCLAHPPLPMNSNMKCFANMCTVTCTAGHKFFDGSTVANIQCVQGQWKPARADLMALSDCQPECSPPCLNGGVCLSVNTCQCPQDYRGPQCQYATSVCDIRKLAFNGGYKCFGDDTKFSCRLSCPAGASFSSPAAELYSCLYSTGIFEPQPIPHCVFDEVIVITPSNHGQSYHSMQRNNTYSGGSSSMEHATNVGQYGSLGAGNQIIVVQDFTPKGGTCLAWAGMHYKTFDGKIYSFQSPCQHILVRDAVEHKYTIAIRQPQCSSMDYCPLELTVYLEEKMYVLSVAEDGSVLFKSTKKLIPIPASLPGIRVAMPSDHVLINLDALGVSVKWDTNNIVMVEGTVLLWNKTEGLCGTLDGNPENDMKIKDGSVVRTKSVMIASWQLNKIGDICDSTPTETSACVSKSAEDMMRALQFCNKVFTKEKFRKCSKVMDVQQLLEACQWDYCACTSLGTSSPEECACNTVSVYAKECLRHGVEEMKSWRDADTCPMKCPDGKIYRSCGPDVQPSCAFPLVTPKNDSCVEGCFCPDGLLLDNNRCVQKSECPCLARKQSFPPGSVIPKSCNTCTCQAGEWKCTQVPCGARCSAVGDPHYTTFDGLRYDFMGHCTYTLLKTDNITVEVENVACSGTISEAMNLTPYRGEGKPSCTKAVNLKYNNANIHLKQGGFILVNGKEVASLPVNVGDIKIRAASSLFVIIQLPIKVDLWWDGNTRVYVDVPPGLHEKTKGLCGTFNLNQKDDFLTPEGDVEQSAPAFANKWKTREFCSDVTTEEPDHPCRANMENKEAAENFCSKLKSKLFESCHWFVDVQPFYEDCLYDMCACSGDPSRCLCPILGDYAMACAQAGVHIQWRYNVKECELSCTGGQEYMVCADSCLRTCADVSVSASGTCKPRCVEGCACPSGQVLDDKNVCVPVGLCPCYHKGMQFKAGYKEVRPGRRERELCTCVGARWDCVPATDADIKNYPPAEDLRSNCSAANNMEFTTCQIAEPLTCKNMHLPPSVTTEECRPGCQCKKGFVLDSSTKKCVVASECPCHHGGRSYTDGHSMKEECNTCECKSGKWSCTKNQCAGMCSAWGDSHMTTFDGADYDFEGVCVYLLAKGVLDDRDGFSVEIQNEPCGTTGATCSKSVTLRVGSGADEETVSLTKSAPLPDVSSFKRIKLRQAGAFVFLDVPSLGMSLQWDRGMRVYVRVDSQWKGRVKGLCGNYNSDMRDDFQSPSGGGFPETSALIFADSWKLKPTCPKSQPVTDHCQERPQRKEWATATCGAMKRYPFSLCHTEVPPGAFVSRCEADACACDSGADCECACAALAAYAHACAARGVAFKWRTQDTCPMQCDEECSNYNECMSPCPAETCDNTLDYAEIRAVCGHQTCVEGCKPNKTCPEGTVYSNSTLKECVPRAKCKPVCMTLPDGTEILEGEIIEEDGCHTCRCSKKTRVCTGQPCSTEAPTGTTPTPETTPHDQPMQCTTGWTPWVNRGHPEVDDQGKSVDKEPLPKPNELEIGGPMCKPDMMTDIECRTVSDHRAAKDTGLNVECSLEQGLVCREVSKQCPDFEIRVLCNCTEKPFQCLDATQPNHPHPTDCGKFYECTPDLMNPSKPHTVLKECAKGLMYNPTVMVCDWPANVISIRPECGTVTTLAPSSVDTDETQETEKASPIPSEKPPRTSQTSPTPQTTLGQTSRTGTVPETTHAVPTTPPIPTTHTVPETPTTASRCPPGQVYSDCAYPCDQLCEHFEVQLKSQGECTKPKKCVSGCIDKSVANIKCKPGSKWRDEKTCVPLRDCTCDSLGTMVKPGGVTINGCEKCQCIDNAMHCDTSECVSYTIEQSSHAPMLSAEPVKTPPEVTISPTPVLSTSPQTTFSTVPYMPRHLPTTVLLTTVTSPSESTDATTYIESSTTFATNATFVPTTHTPNLVTNFTAVPVTTTHLPVTTIVIPSSATPPPECKPDRYKNLLWESEEPLPDKAFTASSVANALFEPQFAMLNGHPLDITAGSWNPSTQDLNQYIQVELPRPEPIYGILMQGSPLFDQYVTSYDVMYGDDGNVFSHIEGPDGNPKVFRGPVDHENAMKQMFEPPIEAKFVRIHPLTWHEEIAVRFELIGCQEPDTTTTSTTVTTPEPMQCTEPLGLAADMPLDSIEVSSNSDARQYFRLDGDRGWRPLYSTPGEWIMFNFTSPRNITGIKTKGGVNGWVTSYNIMYTSDLSTFNPVVDNTGQRKLFPGNFDRNTEVLNEFRPPIHAQYLKVLPVKWNKNIEMRIEPIGCFEPYPTTQPPLITTPAPPLACEPCPGVLHEMALDCNCAPNQYYDGENCVSRDQCPCIVGITPYPVGSSFRGSNCDQCMCKLGGVTDCKPVQECLCESDLVPKLSPSTCECHCEPCPPNTKICPTSKLCLPLEKWCDGLQDCPDDERECTTRTTVTETVVTTVAPTIAATKPTTTLTTVSTAGTTAAPKTCPRVECPPGYTVRITTGSPASTRISSSDLPPPRPRYSYQRYYRGAKGGFSKGGFSKGGFSKGGFSKGGFYGPQAPPKQNQGFSLEKPTINTPTTIDKEKEECTQFKCIPKLPPPFKPGSTPPPQVCSTPVCPPKYTLKLERVLTEGNKCPQYACVPPPERPVFCNVTGRTFNTFDGAEYKLDVCFHMLARENRFNSWSIMVRKKCRIEGCRNELLVNQDSELILVKPNFMIEYDNFEYTVEQTSKICFQKNSFDVGRLGDGLYIKSRKYNFTVFYNKDGDVKIGVFKNYMGQVDGLCGTFDGEWRNDRATPSGRPARSLDEFGKSWLKPGLPLTACNTRVINPEKQKRVWDLCNDITKEPLSQCASVLNLHKWRSICLEKICECTELVVNGSKMSDRECRCLLLGQLVAECLAADKDVDLEAWRTQMDCPVECPPPLVHYDCYRKRCEPTCSSIASAGRHCPVQDGQCSPGCYCPEGKLRKGDQCVLPADCLDCTCMGVGTPAKYVTFEGDDLPFLGNCTYLASRDRNETGNHKYQVYTTNGPCEENKAATCTKIVHLIHEKNLISISKDDATKKLITTVNGSPVYKNPTKNDWATISLEKGQDVIVSLPDLHVELTVLQSNMQYTVRVPSSLYANQTEGMCGVCAGYQEHLVTSNGTVTDDFELYGKSWQATPETLTALDVPPQEQCGEVPPPPPCVLPPPESNPCYKINNVDKFGACHALVEPHPYVEQCEAQLCELNSTDACAVLARYAADCRRLGVCLAWRDEACPYPCETPLEYRSCVDCERTCENNKELEKNPEKCDKVPVEGCFCPEGKVRVNNTCIEPKKCFPCGADKEHFAGDEWQVNECKKCSCIELPDNAGADVVCTTMSCTVPVCSEDEDRITKPAKVGACCPEYMCVPKPQNNTCEEPKKMECGFGQILKQKTGKNGCKEFACECKPPSECEQIPGDNEVDIMEPGVERVIDNSGCCPKASLVCKPATCPKPPKCEQYHTLQTKNVSGKCCPEHVCELPKDKCVVSLEWEAAPTGGEKARTKPQLILKELDASWSDGPCRSCRCAFSPGQAPTAQCRLTECPAILSDEQFVVEPQPVPFACCPAPVYVACRHGNNVYKVGQNWTSVDNPCVSYQCSQLSDGKLDKVTAKQVCDTDCQPGWDYVPASPESGKCCGKCIPVSCVVDDAKHDIGASWTSADFCTNYTCVDLNGTLQVQSSDETCPEVSEAMKKQYVLSDDKIPGKCCPKREPVACRVGNKIYQEGQTWTSSDPCKNYTCARDSSGTLGHESSTQTCDRNCQRGYEYKEPEPGVCCGRCVQTACIVAGELYEPGRVWKSDDNCTTFECNNSSNELLVTSSRQVCPDVSACAAEDLVNETCCQVCKEKPQNLATCTPTEVPAADTVGMVKVHLYPHGLCVNRRPVIGIRECRGTCAAPTEFNMQMGSLEVPCECCRASRYVSISATLQCEDGSARLHRLASAAACSCSRCAADAPYYWGGKASMPPWTKHGLHIGPSRSPYNQFRTPEESAEYTIPDLAARFGPTPRIVNAGY